jgi:ubiquinone/menaquinone biosynthesis C-methylase UbiE
VVSIDLDLYALKRLKLKSDQVDIIQADARFLPIREGVFDVIFMVEVLDYIPELELALSECLHALKPGASSVISFGNKSSVKAKIKSMQGKSYRHSFKEIVLGLTKTGFMLQNRQGYSWLPFGRTSQSSLVPVFAMFEKVFGFRRVVRYSPWVIMHITKPS